jgi:MraZ protein
MLPPEFRDALSSPDNGGRIVLTNFDGCVMGFPAPVWEGIERDFDHMNMLHARVRDFHRFFVSAAADIPLDRQGRVLVPEHLRDYAGLDKDVVVAGVGRKIEIWDRARFEAKRAEMDAPDSSDLTALQQMGMQFFI